MSQPRPRRTAVRVVAALVSALLGLGLLGVPTPAQAAYAKPSSLTAVSSSTSAVRISWKAVAKAPAYRIKYDDNSAMKSPAYAKATSASVELTGLKPGRTYWVKIRVVSASSKALSSYSSVLKVTTRAAGGFSLLSPGGLSASGITDSTMTVGWTARAGADNYRVRVATTKALTDEWFERVDGTSTTLSDLSPGITYYVSVRAITADGTNLSQYSPMVALKTTGKASFAAPTGLSGLANSSSTATLAWKATSGATRYRIKYATTPWADARYVSTTDNAYELSGLAPRTTYYVKLRVLDTDGSFASDYSATVEVTTPAAASALRVASYNVRCHSCNSGAANEQPWSVRRDYVAQTIEGANPDVIGLQEDQQSWLIDPDTGKKVNRSQFEDLLGLLGSPWALTNKYRNNCVKSTTPTNCVYKDRGASNGTKIMYRTDRLELLSQGSKELPRTSPTAYSRYIAWAFFRQKDSGQEFLFANIHLEPENDSGTSLTYYNSRKVQAEAVVAQLAALNTENLPVLLVGDPASSRADSPTNAPYDIFRAAGYIDPLGNVSKSSSPVGATVEKRINTNYNSFNAWETYARRSTANVNGTYTDYIFTSTMRVTEWETVVKVDSDNKFVGVIPSDHNLIRATVLLP
ncbi:MAG: fibronectin type III domain-containing protein [Propionicimonas sp.]|uniref:fibronectin type III domain-containing protein n=1 Tax=Propionicimonas sp. TaxID=1955623 RepID=UPI003D11E243